MKFGLSSGSLFGLSLEKVIQRAYQSGFDFVEILLYGKWTADQIDRLLEYAAKRHVELHFHQTWSQEESEILDWKTWGFNMLLRCTGRQPKGEYRIQSRIPANARPVVVYADRFDEAGPDSNLWFQTISMRTGPRSSRRYSASWSLFKFVAEERRLPLVLDTIHFLEYKTNQRGICLIESTEHEIVNHWAEFWQRFSTQVQEIHFNDFNPALGEAAGRNLSPGSGTAPLKRFADVVGYSKWTGYVVSEIQPSLPFPYDVTYLKHLRTLLGGYFKE